VTLVAVKQQHLTEADTGKPVVVPKRWMRFLRRVMGLAPGRYVIVVSVGAEGCDWSVVDAGKIEH